MSRSVAAFDAHTHLDFPEFDADRDAVVARAGAAGVGTWVIAGSRPELWHETRAIADSTGGIAILGIHPWDAATLDDAGRDALLARLADEPCAGIGEIGLDVLHAKDPAARRRQRDTLRLQLALSRDRDLPVAFHCVRAYPELIALLERDGLPRRGGMMHAWSGPAELVDRAVALGLYVSFAPMILRDRARKARESVPRVPDRALLIETDCPNMAPPGVERGEPAHLPIVAAEVATLRGADRDAILALTAENGRRLFAS